MIDFILHNSTTGELACAHCSQIMYARETARHECEQMKENWAKEAYGNDRD